MIDENSDEVKPILRIGDFHNEVGDYSQAIREEFSIGQEPLTALARCLDIDRHSYGRESVIMGNVAMCGIPCFRMSHR